VKTATLVAVAVAAFFAVGSLALMMMLMIQASGVLLELLARMMEEIR
jgi:hypothetical protein